MRVAKHICKQGRENIKNEMADVSHRKTKNYDHKRIEIDRERFKNISPPERKLLRMQLIAM